MHGPGKFQPEGLRGADQRGGEVPDPRLHHRPADRGKPQGAEFVMLARAFTLLLYYFFTFSLFHFFNFSLFQLFTLSLSTFDTQFYNLRS